MPRNQFWTAADATSTRLSPTWISPDGNLALIPSSMATLTYDAIGSVGGNISSGEVIDTITVNLRAGATYQFLATGTYQVSLVIFDNQGYLLAFDDGDDIGRYDRYPQDSIVNFSPDYTGDYRLQIYYTNVSSATGTYGISALEDIAADGRNNYIGSFLGLAYNNIMRAPSTGVSDFNTALNEIYAGRLSYENAVGQIVAKADASTSVATMSYQFFTGKIPSQLGFDYLVSPTGPNTNNLNSAYYQSFNLENRYINFAVNLGKVGEGKDAFAAKYGALSFFDATREAYKTIFGAAPTDAKIHTLIDTRVGYFASYGGDGPEGQGTKAAMVGWLLAEAEKANVGVFAKSNAAFLGDLADGAAFGVDLVGVYGRADYAFAG